MQSHLPSCWAELYMTAWWPPSPWRLHLASLTLFHLSLGLHGRGAPLGHSDPRTAST